MITTSIVIPVFNCEAYICEAIESCIPALNTGKVELIIINDGSTDSSLELAKCFSHIDNISVLTQANKGVGSARNTGINASRGTFIKFLDADDILKPDIMNIHAEILAKNSRLDVVYSDYKFLNNNSTQRLFL